MSKPLVIAHHLIWTAYGYWLPNDVRGSCSFGVRKQALAELGTLHYGRKRIQPPRGEIRGFLNEAKQRLVFSVIPLTDDATQSSACGLAEAIEEFNYTCYACAVMPDHVHILIRKHKHTADEMIENLQWLSRERLVADGFREPTHPTWTVGGCKRFLDRPSSVRQVIRYIERNPLPIGRPVQRWPFVAEYNDWPLHVGHNPNSPYARRLRECG